MSLKKFTNEIYLSFKDSNGRENPFDIDKYNKDSIIIWNKRNNNISQNKFYSEMTCKQCKQKKLRLITKHLQRYMLDYCGKCIRINTVQERYHVNFVSQLEENKLKAKQTCLEIYGTEHPSQSKSVREKTEQTNMERYGTKHVFQLKEVREKAKQTCRERFGVDNPMQSEEFKNKVEQTNMERYGTKHYVDSEDFKRKRAETNMKRFGVDNVFKLKAIQDRIKQTNMERYHVDNPAKSDKIKEKIKNTLISTYGSYFNKATYRYDNINFDSSWELIFYIYHRDKGHKIIRNTVKCFEFLVNNKKTHYYPDFKLNNQYVEIKGDLFIEFYKNGNPKTFKNPFQLDQTLPRAKYKCMKKHNVHLIWSKQMPRYFKHIIDTYGSLDYLEQFKVNNNDK